MNLQKRGQKHKNPSANVYYRACWCACAVFANTHACRIARLYAPPSFPPPPRCRPDGGPPGTFLHPRRVHQLQHEGAQVYFTPITVSAPFTIMAPVIAGHFFFLSSFFFLSCLSVYILLFSSFLSFSLSRFLFYLEQTGERTAYKGDINKQYMSTPSCTPPTSFLSSTQAYSRPP